MGVGGPGVGGGHAGGELAARRRGGGPEAEGAVDVDPGVALAGPVDDRFERVEGAGVHFAGLGDDDRGAVDVRQLARDEPALVVGGNGDDAVAAQADDGERLGDGRVGLVADDDRHGRGADEAVVAGVPAGLGEDVVAAGGEAAEVGDGGAADEHRFGAGGEAEGVDHPPRDDGAKTAGDGRHDREGGVLVPRGGEDVRRVRGGEDGAVDEAEVAAAGGGDGGGGADAVEQLERGGGVGGPSGEGFVEGGERRDGGSGRSYRTRGETPTQDIAGGLRRRPGGLRRSVPSAYWRECWETVSMSGRFGCGPEIPCVVEGDLIELCAGAHLREVRRAMGGSCELRSRIANEISVLGCFPKISRSIERNARAMLEIGRHETIGRAPQSRLREWLRARPRTPLRCRILRPTDYRPRRTRC